MAAGPRSHHPCRRTSCRRCPSARAPACPGQQRPPRRRRQAASRPHRPRRRWAPPAASGCSARARSRPSDRPRAAPTS
eukprot:1799759-Prymnesium_polylepis.1